MSWRCVIAAVAALPTLRHDLFIILFNWNQKWKAHHSFTVVAMALASSLWEIFPFEIWLFFIGYNGPNYNAVMVTEIYPALPPICCYLNMFRKKSSLLSFLNNSKKLQAATYYVKVYNFDLVNYIAFIHIYQTHWSTDIANRVIVTHHIVISISKILNLQTISNIQVS